MHYELQEVIYFVTNCICNRRMCSLGLVPFIHPCRGRGTLLHMYTEPLLVQLPTPDFSMMFNVICFVSTVVAIAFGSLHNLTTRVLTPIEPGQGRRGLLQRLLGGLGGRGKEKGD